MVIFGLTAQAQTVDDIIARNIQARGGIDKIEAVKSLRISGTMDFEGGVIVFLPRISVQITQMFERPGKLRTEIALQGVTQIDAYDGKVGWRVDGDEEPERTSKDKAKLSADEADFDGPLVHYRDKGNKVKLLGRGPVDGTDAFEIELTPKEGEVLHIFLDADSYLEIQEKHEITLSGSRREVKTTYRDYKEVDGLMFPFFMESYILGDGENGGLPRGHKMRTEKVEINPEFEDGVFEVPAKLRD